MRNSKEKIVELLKKSRSWTSGKVHSKSFIMSMMVASTIVGGTFITQGYESGVEKKQAVITTVEPSYNYFNVSLDNEKKDGLLIEAKAEIVAKQKIEEQRLKSEAEAKAKVIAEARAKAEAEAEVKAKAEAEVRAKAEEERKAKEGYYNSNIPLPKDQQAYLYKKVKERGLDLAETLAVIKIESGFNSNAFSGSSYGYFQIHNVNHNRLSQALGTPNKPYDAYVNIEWGTYMLADLYNNYKAKGYSGQELQDAVLSSYNKGEGGFQKTGKATSYLNKFYKALNQTQNWVN